MIHHVKLMLLLLAVLLVPSTARAQELSANRQPLADKIECPLEELPAGQDAWVTVQADMPVMVAQHVYARVDDPDVLKELDVGNNGHQLK